MTITTAPNRVHKGNRRFQWLGYVLVLFDVLSLAIVNMLAVPVTQFLQKYILQKSLYNELSPEAALHFNIYIVLGTILLLLFWSQGLYSRRIPWWNQVQHIGKIIFFIFIVHGFISFALKLYESRLLITMIWALSFLFMLTHRRILFGMASRLKWISRPVVVIADHTTATDLLYAFSGDPCTGYEAQILFLRDPDYQNFSTSSLPRAYHNIEIRDGRANVENFIQENPDYFYVVSLDSFRDDARNQINKRLNQSGANYALVPALAGANLYDVEPCYFFGQDVTLLEARSGHSALTYFSPSRALKRFMDIVISALALIALAPLFMVIAILMKMEGQGGSVFYSGKRVGRNKRQFRCWKFRSMEPDSDHLLHAWLEEHPEDKINWEKYRKLTNDPRITTRIARIIRKTSLDELPQLWNIFLGEMSLVGPRPILEEEIPYFGDILDDYLSVRPGLTGLWQVSGRNETTFEQRVLWDRWYVRNWSLWGDIVILIKTPIVLLSRKGAN